MKRPAASLVTAALWAQLGGAQVSIGYFGPHDPGHSQGGAYWCGARLAIEEANQQGGYRGEPYRLVSAWDENPWTGGAKLVVQRSQGSNQVRPEADRIIILVVQ